MWMIPLPDEVMSVGAVCRPEYLKQRKGRTVEFLLETLQRNRALWRRIDRAELIGNEVRVTGNYSYDSTRMGAPGWVLVGDAFAFLDPVFSSGVYLAMSGAEQAAAAVDAALRNPSREASLLRKLEKRQRAGMARFSFFIYRFNGPVMQQLFRSPRNTWQLEQGVISMLAGDLFDSPQGAVASAAVQAGVCDLRAAGPQALACRTQVPAGAGADAIHRRQHAVG